MQAIDLVQRRLRQGDGRGWQMFLTCARADAERCGDAQKRAFLACLEELDRAGAFLRLASSDDADAGSVAFLNLAILAALGWMAARMVALPEGEAWSDRLISAGKFFLSRIQSRARALHDEAIGTAEPLADFRRLFG